MKNDYEIKGDETTLYLKRKNGDVIETIIDTNSLPKLKQHDLNWYAAYDPKADAYYVQAYNCGKTVILHRLLFDFPKGKVIDHINHNTLDNRISNLRPVDYSGNGQNRKGAQSDSKSGIRGVHWVEKHKTWKVQVTIQSKKFHVGLYKDFKRAKEVAVKIREKFLPFSDSDNRKNEEFDQSEIKEYIKQIRDDYRTNRSASKEKYINWHKLTKKWSVSVPVNGKRKHIGLYETIEDAKKVRDEAIR